MLIISANYLYDRTDLKKQKKPNEPEIRKFFERKLKESGFLLENKVEPKLKPLFNVDRDAPYFDKDLSKARTIDFVASTFIPDGTRPPKGKKAVASLKLVIECKSLPDHGWIFFPGKDPKITFRDEVSAMKDTGRNSPLSKIVPLLTFPTLYHAASYSEFHLEDKSNNGSHSNKRDDNLYGAVHAVTKATRDQIELMKKALNAIYMRYNTLQIVPIVTLYQPLIIFYGRMYASDTVNDEISLRPLKYAQIMKGYTSEFYNESIGDIHIVHFDALDEYLKLIHDFYWSSSEFIMKNQEDLLDLTYQNAASCKKFSSF